MGDMADFQIEQGLYEDEDDYDDDGNYDECYVKTLLPSREMLLPWLAADNNSYDEDWDSEKTGKWMMFTKDETVDAEWKEIKEMTEDGKLGISSKVSTARPSVYGLPNQHVIIVYTKDYNDKKDVMRVREQLGKMGYKQKLYYKTDQATREGKYGKGSWLYCE